MHDKVIIATHQMLYGASQALRDYLIIKNWKEISYIGLPLLENKKYIFEFYKNGKKREIVKFKSPPIPNLIRYFCDPFVVLYFSLKKGKKNIFIGVDPLNAVVGVVLRKIKWVDYVVFYSIDFVPQRFENKFINSIYHNLEKFCVKNSNESWNVSPRISKGREKFLKINYKKYKQKVVPIGIWKNEISKKTKFKNKHQILFIGHLLEKQGVQEVIRAVSLTSKKIKDIRFLVVGGGEYKKELQDVSRKLDMQNHVNFLDWIKDRDRLKKIMQDSAIAVACYKPEKKRLRNFTYYADPTKLKDYLSGGLPIILTNISHNAKEIEKNKCGIVVDYDRKKISDAIIKLLSNNRLLEKYRLNAIVYAKKFTWDKIFDNAFLEYGQR